jgi:hypothetical protein
MNEQEQIETLRQRIQKIRAEGPVAADSTWIAPFRAGSKRKDGYKYFDYYKLMEATEKRSKTGKIQGRQIAYLGNANNRKYQEAKVAIDRRNEIQRLEAEIKRLEIISDVAMNAAAESSD